MKRKLTRVLFHTSKGKSKCQGCKRVVISRNVIFFKRKYLCYLCRTKLKGFRQMSSTQTMIDIAERGNKQK